MRTAVSGNAAVRAGLVAALCVFTACKSPSPEGPCSSGETARAEKTAVAPPAEGTQIKTPPLPEGLSAYDFGDAYAWWDFASVPGAKGVSISRQASFGTDPSGGDFPDPLFGDYVGGDEITVTISNLKKGLYRAAIIAQNVGHGMVPVRDFAITANGQAAAKVLVTPEWYFSRNGFFYGVQFDDLPNSAFWDRYIEPVAPWRQFTFESGGELALKLQHCRLYALVIAPQAQVSEKDFAAFVEATQAARKAYFLFNKFKFAVEAPRGNMRPRKEDENRGYVIFSRPWDEDVTYNTLPRPADTRARTQLAGTPGERVPLVFSVRTLEPLSSVTVTVSDLVSGEGETIKSSAVTIATVRYMMLHDDKGGFRISPETIQQQNGAGLPANITKTWWLTLKIPQDARAGTYRGRVQFRQSGSPPSLVNFTLEVYPFTLANPEASIGVWYDDPRVEGYVTGLLGGEALPGVPIGDVRSTNRAPDTAARVEAYRLAMLEADLASLAEHGFNGITVPVPRVLSVSRDGDVTLDFSFCEAYKELLKKYGINTDFYGQTYLHGIARQIVKVGVEGQPIEEYSDLHQKAYKNAVAQVRDYWKSAGIKVYAYAVDEPREKNINAWNSNLEGTLYYLRLIRDVGGMLSTVTTMRDVQDGIAYMPIIKAEAIVQPHPSPQNAESVKYARKAGKPIRFFNGPGFERYAFGFYLWSQKPEGYWQWHFDFRDFSFNPFWESGNGYAVFPSPDGPVPTLRYERTAQGIYDYRYALTLEKYIERARAAGKPKALEAAKKGQALLDEIRRGCTEWVLDRNWEAVSIPPDRFGLWRGRVARQIQALQQIIEQQP